MERKDEQNVDIPHCHFSSKTSDVFYCWLLFIHIYLMNGFIDFFFFQTKAHKVYDIDFDLKRCCADDDLTVIKG